MIVLQIITKSPESAYQLIEGLNSQKLIGSAAIHENITFFLFGKKHSDCVKVTALTKALLYQKAENFCLNNPNVLNIHSLPVTHADLNFTNALLEQTQKI